jgi:hypothetical protein
MTGLCRHTAMRVGKAKMYLIGKSGSKDIGKSCVGDCFSDGTMDEIVSGAFGILEGVGIRIPDRKVRDRLVNSGYEQRDGRVFIARHAARAYLEKTIARRLASPEAAWTRQYPYSFDGSINTYPSHYEDPVNGRILPFDTESLILMTRFIEAYSKKEGFTPSVPGYPNDAPPSLEGLIRYKVCAGCCSRGWFAIHVSFRFPEFEYRIRFSGKTDFRMDDRGIQCQAVSTGDEDKINEHPFVGQERRRPGSRGKRHPDDGRCHEGGALL